MAAPFGRSVAAGSDVAGFNPRQLADAWKRNAGGGVSTAYPLPRLVNDDAGARRTQPGMTVPNLQGVGFIGGGQGGSNPYSKALANVRAGGTGITATPKSEPQNAFTQSMRNNLTASAPGKASSLTQFVRDAYARTGNQSKVLDQENAAIDRIFSDNGLVDELADSRAKRKAGVMMASKMAMDRARRQNNVNRMMSGNNTYNDRLYADALANIAVQGAIQDSDLERDDIRYLQGERMGAVGTRDRLLKDYLSLSRIPYYAQRDQFMDDMAAGGALAQLENNNTVFETPEQRLQREIRMAEGMDRLQSLNDQANEPAFTPAMASFAPAPAPAPVSAPMPPAFTPPFQTPRTGRFFRTGVPAVFNNRVRFSV